jgi:hypothetical protein
MHRFVTPFILLGALCLPAPPSLAQSETASEFTPQQFAPQGYNIADGSSHLLSSVFGATGDTSCQAAHKVFPFIAPTMAEGCDLAAELAWAAIVQALTVDVSASWYGRRPFNSVTIPPGKYLINRTIMLANGDGGRIEGSGPSRTIFLWNGDSQSPMFRLDSCRHLDLSNFTVQVGGSAKYLKYVFFTGEITGPEIKSINSSNHFQSIIVTTPDSNNPNVGWFVYNGVGSFWGQTYTTSNGEGYLFEDCAAVGLAEDGFYSDAFDTASTTFINTRFWGVKAGVRANAGYNFCCGSDISGAREAAFIQGPNVNAPITITGVNIEDSYALFKNSAITRGMTSQAQPVSIDNIRYTASAWMGYSGTVTADGSANVTLAGGTPFAGSKAAGWIEGKPITIGGINYTVQTVVDARHLLVDRPVPASAGSSYPFSVPGLDPNGVIQIAQHGPVTLRNSTIGVDGRFPLRVWWNNNPGYGHTPSLFRIENVIFHSKGPKFAHSTTLTAGDALFIGAWPDTVNSWMMTGAADSGVGTNVSMSTQPVWIKHRVTKAGNNWQIDEGALPSSPVTAGTDNAIVLTPLPAGSYTGDVTLKTVVACTGVSLAVTGLGNNTDGRYYASGILYDLSAPASPSNQLNVPLAKWGSSRLTVAANQEDAVQEYFTVFLGTQKGKMTDVADGCTFDVYMLAGRRPMELPTGH